ncbi:DnaJ subfamily C member 9 [Portunus trituberculatus]|uniref:DnaJ subfamily C member 9 n=1 Tax=Portunus trituberculatus TaxID=210409 RepID=A0A5B7DL03_PORTR|nr:DnaJ subfamily C member 9 [Portunus trituberculatus]
MFPNEVYWKTSVNVVSPAGCLEVREVDEENTPEDKDWNQYWRLLFKKITVESIKNFEREYKDHMQGQQSHNLLAYILYLLVGEQGLHIKKLVHMPHISQYLNSGLL